VLAAIPLITYNFLAQRTKTLEKRLAEEEAYTHALDGAALHGDVEYANPFLASPAPPPARMGPRGFAASKVPFDPTSVPSVAASLESIPDTTSAVEALKKQIEDNVPRPRLEGAEEYRPRPGAAVGASAPVDNAAVVEAAALHEELTTLLAAIERAAARDAEILAATTSHGAALSTGKTFVDGGGSELRSMLEALRASRHDGTLADAVPRIRQELEAALRARAPSYDAAAEDEEVHRLRFCPGCGNATQNGARYCVFCGLPCVLRSPPPENVEGCNASEDGSSRGSSRMSVRRRLELEVSERELARQALEMERIQRENDAALKIQSRARGIAARRYCSMRRDEAAAAAAAYAAAEAAEQARRHAAAAAIQAAHRGRLARGAAVKPSRRYVVRIKTGPHPLAGGISEAPNSVRVALTVQGAAGSLWRVPLPPRRRGDGKFQRESLETFLLSRVGGGAAAGSALGEPASVSLRLVEDSDAPEEDALPPRALVEWQVERVSIWDIGAAREYTFQGLANQSWVRLGGPGGRYTSPLAFGVAHRTEAAAPTTGSLLAGASSVSSETTLPGPEDDPAALSAASAAFAMAAVRHERPTWTIDDALEAEPSFDESEGDLAEVPSQAPVRMTALPPLALEARRLPQLPQEFTLAALEDPVASGEANAADDTMMELGASVDLTQVVAVTSQPPPDEYNLMHFGISEPPRSPANTMPQQTEGFSSVESSPEHMMSSQAAPPPSVVEPETAPSWMSAAPRLESSPPRPTFFAGDNGDLFTSVRLGGALRVPSHAAAGGRPLTGHALGQPQLDNTSNVGMQAVANLLEDLYGREVESPPPTAGAAPRFRGAGAWDD